ncbi:MAG: carbamoyl-phosphate synthase large subunit [Verrucomicrobia bacterium]|nr:carbamoyl-phosphate synthase large subunit [Verrucomicrobiota bacterium]MDA1065600.1 carbamoyl-phosphate synthase large subunit [Verrucomicrobiota bacterium]
MPKRTDLESILIIGSGPIIIGQACEFDYSGTQACKALREEGYRVILVNSNPATIMTDPEFADVTYIEPLTVEIVTKIIEKERPDALLPTLGGQTALNLALDLDAAGILKKFNVEMIGAKPDAIKKGEDRLLFKKAMIKIGLDVAKSRVVYSLEEARNAAEKIGPFPLIIRPGFTMGGAGGGIAYNKEEFDTIVANGLEISPVTEVLVEECLLGWKEYEMEVMRDYKDQCVIVCSIENFDPMGVHTGDSITIAPAMTLTDKEYQLMRDASFACIREIGVETGGSNIQFSVNPVDGRLVVIEMNPRVSRSSALASKATGFPIAKFAAKLAVGYSLDEIQNDITRETPASFEPSIDYVVTKIPRFTFEKFEGADTTLTSSMKSVGEAMAIGRTFKESFQKALRSLEVGSRGLGGGGKYGADPDCEDSVIRSRLSIPNAERIFYIRYALLNGMSEEEVFELTSIDPWFVNQIAGIVAIEKELAKQTLQSIDNELLREAKEAGFSDAQLSYLLDAPREAVKSKRESIGLKTIFRLVDTCAAEFEAFTPYYYSSYGDENEVVPSDKPKIMILGGGPNRIGQGIEFDYCCVHASYALQEAGFETVMVNSNPETVSTDYDTSDRLYFEPLTLEDVLAVYEQEKCQGAIVQFGGQTPLNLATELKANGVNIIGTSPENIDAAEDRKLFADILNRVGLRQPANRIAMNAAEAYLMAEEVGFPILLRPSFVLGGRGMFVVSSIKEMEKVVKETFEVVPDKPVLIDRFLEDAIEVDVDCISDGETILVGGILEHIEFAGVHSGDAGMVMPPHTLSEDMINQIKEATYSLAKELNVIGLMNVQFVIKDNELFIIEVNPRASRTVPFVSKAIGVQLAKLAARVMAGATLKELGFTEEVTPKHWCIKESVFPFKRFPGSKIALTPEMRSTGEVMGMDMDYGIAFAKTQMAVQPALPTSGNVFISVKDGDKNKVIDIASRLVKLGFKIYSTSGTARFLIENGVAVEKLFKIDEGRPHVVDMIKNGGIQLIVNTPSSGMIPRRDENIIRTEAIKMSVCITTTIMAAESSVLAIEALRTKPVEVKSLQEYYAERI